MIVITLYTISTKFVGKLTVRVSTIVAVECDLVEGVEQAEFLDRIGRGVADALIADDDGESLGTGDRNVEAVAVEDEFEAAGPELAGTGAKGKDDDRRFLALEAVDRADFGPCGQRLFEAADLEVVRGDKHDVIECDRPGVALAVGEAAAEQNIEDFDDCGDFFVAGLGVAPVRDVVEIHPAFDGHRP